MYKLLLTGDERRAIDWIGDRYSHGNDLFSLLWGECYPNSVVGDEYADWGSQEDITFYIPEYTAWEIRRIGEECNFAWDCFGPVLYAKMNEFCKKIV